MVHEADKEPNLPPRPNPAQINNSMRYVTASCVRQPLSDSRSSNQTSMAANNRTLNETFNYVDILDFVIPPPGSATGQTTNLNSSLNLDSVLPSTQQISSNIQSWMSGTNGSNNGVSNNEYLALSHHQSPVPTLAPTTQVTGSIPRPVSLHNHQSSSSNNRAKHHLIDFNNSSSSSNSLFPFNTNSADSQLIKSPEDIERDEKIELVKSLIVNNNNNNNNNNQSISSNNNNNNSHTNHNNHNNNNLSLRSNRPVSIPPLSSSVSALNGQINFVANQLYSYQHHPQSNQINLNYVNIKSNNNNNLNSNTLNNNQFSFGATCKPNNSSSSVSASITSPILANIPNNNNNNNGFTFYQNIPMSGFVNPNYSNRSEQMIINKINNNHNNSNFENTSNNNNKDIESKLKQITSPTIDKFQFPSPSTTPVTTTASPFLVNSRESGILTPTSIFVPPNDSSKTIIDMFDPLAQPVPDTPPPPYPLVASAIATESSNSKSNESNTSGKQSPDESSKEVLADSGSDSDVNSGSSSPKSLNQSEIFECLQIEERPIWQQNQELQHFCDHLKALYITISSKSNLANSGLVFSPQIEIKTKFSESEEFYKATDEVELSENMATFVVRFHPKVFAKLTNKSVDQYNPEKDYIKMCCSINSTVEAIVSHVIFNVDACDEKYSETINSQDFLLKFHGRNEFLVPETSLSSYVFVHQCKAMSLDVSLELVDQTLPELWRPFQRSKSDIDRIQNRFTADQLLPSQLLNRFIPINFNHLSGLIDNLNVDYGTFVSFLDVSAGISKQEKNKFFTNILNRIQKICNFLSHIESSQLRDDIQTFKELNERCLLNEQTGDFPNLDQLFNKAYFEIIKSLAKIIELYSKCFPVNFRLKKSANSDNDNKNNNNSSSNNKKASTRLKMSITMLIDTFSVYVDCGVQAPEEWRHQYSSFALRAIIYHGLNVLDYKYLDQFVAVDESNRLEFKQKLSFNMLISNLPRETRVEFLLLGLKGPFPGEKPLSAQTRIEADGIASTFLFMFDYEQRYQQGAHLLPLTVLKPAMTFPSPLSFNNNETIREFKQSLPETCPHFLDYNSDPSASMLLITVDDNDNFDYYFPEIRETQSNTHSNSRSMLDTVIPFPRSLSSISDCSTQDSLYGFYGRNIGQLDKHNRSKIVNILQRNPLEPMSRLERELIWENRQTLSDYPGAILKIMNSPPTWSYHDLKIIYQLLEQFDSYPSPGKSLPNEVSSSLLKLPFNSAIEALQLLDTDFTDTNLRQMAVRWLSTVSIDELCDYLPQLVQSLRYESYVYCSLIWLLFESSLNSVRFCHFFYWNLNLCRSDPLFGDRCQIYMNSLLILCGQKVCDMFRKQDSLCSKLAGICAEIKAAKEPSRNKLLASRLEHIHELLSESPISIPLSPSMQVCGLEVSQCSYFPSNSLPLKIVFHGTPQYQSTNENQAPAIKSLPLCEARKTLTQIIFKCGDDLRQDMLVMQIISIINRIWLRDGLDLRLIIFGVMNNADRTGMIEMVGRAKTLRQIQVQHGVTGSFKQNTISDWLKGHNPSQFDYGSAVGNFVHSCAGYVVITYLLGICDRHNDNIMVTTSGHLFHIDFGKFLGDAQMMAGFKRDRVPFVFTADMAYVINSGDKPTKEYHYFVDLCCKCFSLIRQNGHFLLSLFSLMIPSGIFGLTPETIKYFHNALMPQYSDSEARAQFNRLIEKALGSFSTQFNFFLHNIAQMRFSSDASGSGTNYEAIRGSDSGIGIDSPIGDDQTLTEMDQSCCDFSFNKRRFTQALDGKIVRVEIVGIWKRYEEMEKVYYYKIKIERKNFPDNYVYRSYKELVELNEKISDFFKMVKFVRLTRSPLLGRTNTHEVAEQRCTEIRQFLYNLMSMASEISHSDMVYTFFHSVNRDQDYLEEHQSMIETRHNNAQNSLNQMLYSCDARGQIKLCITYRDRKLQILVSHAKNLKSMKNPAGPDTYVKLYLLPDPNKSTKRKTRVVSRSAFPTYMESLVYDNVYPEELKKRSLEASVWEHDSLGSRCLGSAYIGLGQLDLKAKTEDWFPLETNSL